MGVTVSTSLSAIKENPILLRLAGAEPIADGDTFWKDLLSFGYSPPKDQLEARLLDDAVSSLVDNLLKHNHSTGHIRTLVRRMLKMAAELRDESKCESNLATLQVHNAVLMIRVVLKQVLVRGSEEEAIVQLDGAATIPQISSLESQPKSASPQPVSVEGEDPLINLVQAAPGSSSAWNKDRLPTTGERLLEGQRSELPPGSSLPTSMNAAEVVAMETLLSRQLVEGLISLLVEVPLLPFTYDLHCETISLLLVLLSSQMFGQSSSPGSGILLQHIITTPTDLSNLLVQSLITHFILQPSPPPLHLRSHSSGLLSSITSGIWSLVVPSSSSSDKHSPLADMAILLLLVLTHQQMHGSNPFRSALFQFTDDHTHSTDRGRSSFSISLDKLYMSLCRHHEEQTTLFLYLLLQGNPSVASFIISRSDIDLLVLPLLRHLHDNAQQSSHHVYMLLIILLMLSQDDCFNKSIHKVSLPTVTWYKERSLTNISLGSLTVIMLLRTIQVNISQIRDKYLHTNCLAALANMSSHFHSLHLDAAQKLVNLFKLLSKKHHKIAEKIRTSPSSLPSPLPSLPSPLPSSPSSLPDEQSREQPDYATDQSIVEEILLMLIEILNSCLTHSLHHNPHLVYSLLYQREVFEAFRTSPTLMDLIGNIDNVIEFFSKRLEDTGPSPYSSAFVLDSIVKASQVWPRHRLRVFPDLKFRYVEEDQPEEFFVPYVWTLVLKTSPLYWDHSRLRLITS